MDHNIDNPKIVNATELSTNNDEDDDVQCTSFRSANIEVNDDCNVVDEHKVEVIDEHVE